MIQREGDADTDIVSETLKVTTEKQLLTVIADDTDMCFGLIIFYFSIAPPPTWLISNGCDVFFVLF